MRQVLILSSIAAIGCHSSESVMQPEPTLRNSPVTTTQVEHPLLTFDVVPILGDGIAEEVTGEVKILRDRDVWVPLSKGTEISDGSKVQLGAGSRLRIRFAPDEQVDLKSPGQETWLVFEQRPR